MRSYPRRRPGPQTVGMARMTDLERTLVSLLDTLADEATDPMRRLALLYASHAVWRAACARPPTSAELEEAAPAWAAAARGTRH